MDKVEQIRKEHKNCNDYSGCMNYSDIHYLLSVIDSLRMEVKGLRVAEKKRKEELKQSLSLVDMYQEAFPEMKALLSDLLAAAEPAREFIQELADGKLDNGTCLFERYKKGVEEPARDIIHALSAAMDRMKEGK